MGNDKGKGVLINILSTRLGLLIEESRNNSWALIQSGKPIIRELGNLRDSRAVPILINVIMFGDVRGNTTSTTKAALLKIGKSAIPDLEETLSKKDEHRKIWVEKGISVKDSEWRFLDVSDWGIQEILSSIKKK